MKAKVKNEYKKQKKAMNKVIAQAKLVSKAFYALSKTAGKMAKKIR